jgi:mRNA interferase MazF
LKSGEIHLVDLDPTVGDEIRKTRPVVVLNAGDAKNLRLAIVVPVTRWRPQWDENPFFLTAEAGPRHGLGKKLAVDCFQIRALSHQRFVKRLGELSEEEMDRLKTALSLILDVEPQHCR